MEIILPDGSKKTLEEGATVYDVAASIGTSLAKAALAGKVNGELVDVTAPVTDGATVEIITNKSPEALSIMRHSCAHIMAEAVQELFPGAQIAFGPATDNGYLFRRFCRYREEDGSDREEERALRPRSGDG